MLWWSWARVLFKHASPIRMSVFCQYWRSTGKAAWNSIFPPVSGHVHDTCLNPYSLIRTCIADINGRHLFGEQKLHVSVDGIFVLRCEWSETNGALMGDGSNAWLACALDVPCGRRVKLRAENQVWWVNCQSGGQNPPPLFARFLKKVKTQRTFHPGTVALDFLLHGQAAVHGVTAWFILVETQFVLRSKQETEDTSTRSVPRSHIRFLLSLPHSLSNVYLSLSIYLPWHNCLFNTTCYWKWEFRGVSDLIPDGHLRQAGDNHYRHQAPHLNWTERWATGRQVIFIKEMLKKE